MIERVAARTSLQRVMPAAIWMLLIFALSSREQLPDPGGLSVEVQAIIGHLVLFGVLTALVLLALGARRWSAPVAMVAFALVVAYALTDEFHQSFVAGRDASSFDVFVDASAALIVLGIWACWSYRQDARQ